MLALPYAGTIDSDDGDDDSLIWEWLPYGLFLVLLAAGLILFGYTFIRPWLDGP